MDYPSVFAARRNPSDDNTECTDHLNVLENSVTKQIMRDHACPLEEVMIDLPEYDLRRALAAQDP